MVYRPRSKLFKCDEIVTSGSPDSNAVCTNVTKLSQQAFQTFSASLIAQMLFTVYIVIQVTR